MSGSEFQVESSRIDRNRWGELISQFDDATIYQTWSYGAVFRGAQNVSHLIVKSKGEVVGCCQVSTRRIPMIGVRVADVNWGPLWRRSGSQSDQAVFVQLIRGLRNHYGVEQGHILRVWPNATMDHHTSVGTILECEGFSRNEATKSFRTLRLDLSPSLDTLRKNLSQKWRNCLNKAEKKGLRLKEGTDGEYYQVFLSLAKEMLSRKKFTPGVDYDAYGHIQKDLPEQLKMRIIVCEFNGEPISVSMFSAIGDTGIYLLGATGDKGMGLNGAYLTQWRTIERLKELGFRWYDLGGIDPENNPGVYDFKLGIIGKQQGDQQFLGEFNGCFTPYTRFGTRFLSLLRSLRGKILKV